MATKTERYCRHRSPSDRAATLISIKRQMLKNHDASSDHLETLQFLASLIEIDRAIVLLGYSPDLEESR
jgi:hypothetical protein